MRRHSDECGPLRWHSIILMRTVLSAFCIWTALGLPPSKGFAQSIDNTRIIHLVLASQALEVAQEFTQAADVLEDAIKLLENAPVSFRHDMSVLKWRYAWLRFRAFQTDESPNCESPIQSVLQLGREAWGAARETGDKKLQTDVAELMSGLSLTSGAYADADTYGTFAAAQLQQYSPCHAASVHRIRTQAALLARNFSGARSAMSRADDLHIRGQCSAEDGMQNRILAARIAIMSGDLQTASEILARLRQDDALATSGPVTGSIFYNSSEVELMRGRYAEAELLNERARAAYRLLPPSDPIFAQIDHRAAIVRQELGDLPAASMAYEAALRSLTCRLGESHPSTATVQRESARLKSRMGDHEAAIAQARAAIAAGNTAALEPYDRALNLAALGLVLHEAGDRRSEAEATLAAALAALQTLEQSTLDQTPSLAALAEISLSKGDVIRALDYAGTATNILSANASASVQRLGRATRILAQAYEAAGDADRALALARENRVRAFQQLVATSRLATYTSALAPDEIRAQLEQLSELLWRKLSRTPDDGTADELFRTLQIVHLTGTARGATGLADAMLEQHPELIEPVRAERALLAQIEGYERVLRSSPNEAQVDTTRREIHEARARLAGIEADFPKTSAAEEYRRITEPRTVGLDDVRGRLEDGQVFWLQATFDRITFVVLASRNGYRIARTPMTDHELEIRVQALRASVDLPVGVFPVAQSFPVKAAHALYCALFGPFDPSSGCSQHAERIGAATLTDGDELFLVPDRAMQQMAMAVLLTRPLAPEPAFEDLRKAAWFVRRYPHQTAPTTIAFVDRDRRTLHSSARDFVGFAPFGSFRAGLCDAGRQPVPKVTPPGYERLIRPFDIVDPIRAFQQDRLPMTVELVRTAARDFGAAPNRDWFECEAATESEVKRQDLGSVDVLLFATHAEVGELPEDLPEPGIFLAAPAHGSGADDGYLKASEIAQLRIDANLVVLSACSTGSDSGLPGASGLSGLARAFFQAGAASLIVSHWDVAAVSSSALFQSLMSVRGTDASRSLAQDLQAAMLRLMATDRAPVYAHPFVWAPFTVVVGR